MKKKKAAKQAEKEVSPSQPNKERKSGKINISDSTVILADSASIGDSIKPTAIDTSAGDSTLTGDSAAIVPAIDSFNIRVSKDSIDAPIDYSAEDSIVYDIANKKMYLYGKAKVVYKETTMEAEYITVDWAENILSGETKLDSLGQPIGDVVFTDGASEPYLSKKLAYNFKTKRGEVFKGRTREDEGFVHLTHAVRNEEEEWFAEKGWYTTCDQEHPHFYIEAEKMKLVPEKVMVTGPAHLVIRDVPTPLYLPFGIFPVKKGRRSGIVMPEFGEDPNRGFMARNGGYYFGISEHFDLKLTGDIYTKGSWATHVQSRYAKRYKFGGNIDLNFGRTLIGEPEAPTFNISNDFRVNWQHTQSDKARPGSSFSANVNFGSSSYDRNFGVTQQAALNSQLISKVNYSKSWLGGKLNLGVNVNHSQSLVAHSVSLTLPQITFGVSRIQPFKRKIQTGTPRWYENLGFNYNFEAQNTINGTDTSLFHPSNIDNFKYGIKQTLPISTSIKVFKYFTLSPSFNYTERTYFERVEKRFDPTTIYVRDGIMNIIDTLHGQVITDTIRQVGGSRDFSGSLSLTTRVFGMLKFKNAKVKALRHVMTPTVAFRGRPDFAKEFWGQYKTVQIDTTGKTQQYSVFESAQNMFGQAPQGAEAGLSLSIGNTLEMKVHSEKDTVKHEKKVKILEAFDVSTFYNFVADSLKLSPISISMRTTLFEKVAVQFRTSLDPYVYDDRNIRVNRFVWSEDRRLVTMRNADVSISTSLQSGKGDNIEEEVEGSTADEEEKLMVLTAPSMYYDFSIPWSFGFSYSLRLARGMPDNPDTVAIAAHAIQVNADITITEKWKLTLESGYDFQAKDLVFTRVSVIRDMHCWELSVNWVPYPLNRQSYSMQLNVKAQVLQQLKLSRKKNQAYNSF